MNKKILLQQINIIKKLIEIYQRLLEKVQRKPYVVIHHTATNRDRTSWEAIDRGHKRRGYSKSTIGYHIAYNYLIEGNGNTVHARGDNDTELACSACRGFHINICLTGNFQTEKPSERQKNALDGVLGAIRRTYGRVRVVGHRDKYATLCPGDNLYEYITKVYNQ